MIISYLGNYFLKIQFGDTTIAFNPISKDSKLKTNKFGADIAILSMNHKDFNGVDQLIYGDRKPFVISGPGEYEIKEVFIKGFNSKTKYDGTERNNTVYSVFLEGMRVFNLGAISDSKSLSNEAFEEAEEGVDILITPIGGNQSISGSEAYKLAVNLEAKVIIPVFNDEKDLKTFLKEGDAQGIKPIDKLTLKKKDLEGKNGEILVLSSL